MKQNNDWGHKAFFSLLRRIDFFLYPQKSFSCPWHISCIIFKTAEDHNPTRGALLPSQQRLSPPHPCSPTTTRLVLFFIYFLFFLWRGKIPSAICWRRKAFAGEQDCSLFYCLPSALAGVTATPPLVSRWRLSVTTLAETGMLKSRRLRETVKKGRRDVRRRTSGRVSMKDDWRIVTSTDGKQGDVSFSSQGLQFCPRLRLRSKKKKKKSKTQEEPFHAWGLSRFRDVLRRDYLFPAPTGGDRQYRQTDR